MIQSDPSVEQIVRDDLLNSIAQKIEDVAIEGGASNEPTGITGTTGIGSVAIGTNGGAMTWAKITDLVKEVEVDNAAINANTLAYLTNPKVKSHLASTAKVASTDSVMLLDAPWDQLYGYNMAVTNNVPSDLTKGSGTGLSAMIYGDFSQLMIGFFSTPDVLIDPYTGGSSGRFASVSFRKSTLLSARRSSRPGYRANPTLGRLRSPRLFLVQCRSNAPETFLFKV